MHPTTRTAMKPKSITAVGAGGNIGSHLVSHLGRMKGLKRVTLVDRDTYEESNLAGQNITRQDVGRPKAKVQAHRLRRINGALQAEAIVDLVQNVPLGTLRSDVILGCLDSREARRYVSEAAWHLGIPYLDAGVQADGLLARLSVYVPGPTAPCLQCTWDERDYEHLEGSYPCLGGDREPGATNSPSSLGALAASLQAIECQKLLSGQWDGVAAGKEVVISAAHHKHYVSAYRRNPACRFSHNVWEIRKLRRGPGRIAVGRALALAGSRSGGGNCLSLRAAAEPFVTKLTCPDCGAEKRLLRLRHRLTPRQLSCRNCATTMVATGFDMLDGLEAGRLPPHVLERSLQSVGFRSGDIFTVSSPEGDTHYELGS